MVDICTSVSSSNVQSMNQQNWNVFLNMPAALKNPNLCIQIVHTHPIQYLKFFQIFLLSCEWVMGHVCEGVQGDQNHSMNHFWKKSNDTHSTVKQKITKKSQKIILYILSIYQHFWGLARCAQLAKCTSFRNTWTAEFEISHSAENVIHNASCPCGGCSRAPKITKLFQRLCVTCKTPLRLYFSWV